MLVKRVYPRWRGEHGCRVGEMSEESGLSPLARGTLITITYRLAISRFIPAGAGNTWNAHPLSRRRTVYPRWRGEHTAADFAGYRRHGLSPLARGTHGRGLNGTHFSRFIPAGAGNTRSGLPAAEKKPVYPRWRGEHFIITSIVFSSFGLSPLARGTHQDNWHHFDIVAVYPRWRGEHTARNRPLSRCGGLSPLARGTPY